MTTSPEGTTLTTLTDLISPKVLAAHLAEGEIRAQVHPDADHLTVYNYTEKAAYSRVWTEATLACRGLIVDTRTGEVLARPFRKFFNTGEHADSDLAALAVEPVEVWDKLDGSLGVLYPGPDGLAVATRGSFASDQARHATELLRRRYGGYRPPAGVTVLFEIIYPENRIVVDYGGLDDLVLLGAVDVVSGATVPFEQAREGWPGPVVERQPFNSLAEALAAPEVRNREGFVIRFTRSDVRVKAKFADYVRLHRLITGVTARTIWEYAGVVDLIAEQDARRVAQTMRMDRAEVEGIVAGTVDGDWMSPFLEAVPEEFEDWVRATAATIQADVDEWEAAQRATFMSLDVAGADRRIAAQAITALPKELQGALFALLDGKSIRANAWRATRPAHEVPFCADTEGAA